MSIFSYLFGFLKQRIKFNIQEQKKLFFFAPHKTHTQKNLSHNLKYLSKEIFILKYQIILFLLKMHFFPFQYFSVKPETKFN